VPLVWLGSAHWLARDRLAPDEIKEAITALRRLPPAAEPSPRFTRLTSGAGRAIDVRPRRARARALPSGAISAGCVYANPPSVACSPKIADPTRTTFAPSLIATS
jgi:hypothetical protein